MKRMAFSKRLKSWLSPPAFLGDEKKSFQANLLNSLILSLLAVMVLVLIFTNVVSTAKLPTNVIVLLTCLVLLICKIQLHRGQMGGIQYAIPILLWLNSTVLVFWAGGTTNVSMIYYVIAVVFVTLLFGRRGAVIIYAITGVVTLGIAIAQTYGWLPDRVFLTPPVNGWLILMLSLLISVITIGLAIDSRENALASLRESEAKYRALYEALSDPLILVDQESGLILDANQAAFQTYGYNREELIGKPFNILSDEPEKTQTAFSETLGGVPLRYHRRKDGSLFPIEINAGSFTLGGKAMRIGSVRNISERLEAEQRERSISRHLTGIINAAEKLIRCETLDDVYRRAVELGREELGLERCGLFVLDKKKGMLIGTYGTDPAGYTTDERGAYRHLPEMDRPPFHHQKQWKIEYDTVSHWQGDHPVYGQEHWTANTIIQSPAGPIGIFYNDTNITNAPLDRSQQEAVAVYCSLLGSIIEQKLAEARRDQVSDGLRAIISATDELVLCENLDMVYRRAVELGREKMGLERCALFLLDESMETLQGTYGTDEQGHTTDERSGRVNIAEKDRILNMQRGVWQISSNDNAYIQDGEQVKGALHWYASTIIHSSDRPLGIFFNDSLITSKPVDEIQQETLAVYCSLLGNIIERKNAELRQQEVGKGLRAVIDAADELIQCPDLNALCRRAIELAQQKLEAERCSLFIFDAESNLMRGTYGTDIHGNIVNEAAISWSTDFQLELESSAGRTWHFHQGEYRTLVGDHLETVGQGWIAQTLLHLGTEPIGLFVNDTAISNKPVNPVQQELIAIYCSLLENMIKQKRVEAALKRATITLRASEERYRQAIEAAGAVPYFQDYETHSFTFMGENIFQLTGYSSEEMTPAFWDTLVEEAIPGGGASGLSEEEAIPLARTGKISQWQCDYRIRTRFGESRWIMDSAVEIFDEHGISRASIGILQDITARKQAEAEREKLIAELENKNAELERFTYTVSHDLKSPLITIQGFLSYLLKDAEQGNIERLRTDINRISDAAVRMQHLLNDLLELSRIGRITNPPKHIPFVWIVEEALNLVKGRLDRGGVKVTYDENLLFVYGDSARLVEVVQNLVDNAAKFMEGQENPSIEIGQQGCDENGQTLFYVRDNGIGIPPQYHERIFGLFNKLDAKSEGTGVGLALVKRIVEVHGGRIWVESAGLGQGSTFYFTLPGSPPKDE